MLSCLYVRIRVKDYALCCEARSAARLNLEYEIDDIRVALDSLHLDLEEISETGLLAEELKEEWEDEDG